MASATVNYSIPYPTNNDQVDVAGDIQNLAEYIDENIPDIIYENVGLMVESNTESGISVSYDPSDNTIDFVADDFDLELSGAVSGSATISSLTDTLLVTEAKNFDLTFIGDVSGSGTISNLSNTDFSISVTDDSHSHSSGTIQGLSTSDISDIETGVVENGQILSYDSASASWVNVLPNKRLFISGRVTNFMVQDFDIGRTILINSSSPTNVILPSSSSVYVENGSVVSFVMYGSGSVNFVEDVGVTIKSKNNVMSMSDQYGKAQAVKLDNEEWLLFGDIS